MVLMGFFRDFVRQRVYAKREADHVRKLAELKPSFDAWIRSKEEGLPYVDMTVSGERSSADPEAEYAAREGAISFRIVPMSRCGKGFSTTAYIEDIIVFCNGELSDSALSLMAEFFASHEKCLILTGDEDIAFREQGDGQYTGVHYGDRENPYFKPEWSPAEFAAHFYFCNIVAVRRIALRSIEWTGDKSGAAGLYHNIAKIIYANEFNAINSTGHIGQVLIHAHDYKNNLITDPFVAECARILNRESHNELDVSAVILTEDALPALIETLDLLVRALDRAGLSREIIVVDNASPESSRSKTVDLQLKYNFVYDHLTVKDSRETLLKRGIAKAKGRMVLLLSDKVQFTDPDALAFMYETAGYKFSGVTGVKLLKAGSDRILDVGMVAARLGLMHKLRGLSDKTDHLMSCNRFTKNVSAVSLECAMFRRRFYERVGGFDQGLTGDVMDADFCLRLLESGYYNAVSMEHAVEYRLSQAEKFPEVMGDSGLTPAERSKFKSNHPILSGADPFYPSRLLSDNRDPRVLPAYEFEYETAATAPIRIEAVQNAPDRTENGPRIEVEYAGTLGNYLGKEGIDDNYLQGYMYITAIDNACFLKSVLLKGEGTGYILPTDGCYRSDVAMYDPTAGSTELSGFALRVGKGLIAPGTYQIGCMFTGLSAKESFVNYSDVYLTVNK